MIYSLTLLCKRRQQIHLSKAYKEFGDLIVECSVCQAKNIIALALTAKAQIPEWYGITGWRD